VELFQFQNLRVQLPRKFLPIRAPLAEFGEPDRNLNSLFAQEVYQVGDESHILPVTHLLTRIAIL
jgi:hypothetical protein